MERIPTSIRMSARQQVQGFVSGLDIGETFTVEDVRAAVSSGDKNNVLKSMRCMTVAGKDTKLKVWEKHFDPRNSTETSLSPGPCNGCVYSAPTKCIILERRNFGPGLKQSTSF